MKIGFERSGWVWVVTQVFLDSNGTWSGKAETQIRGRFAEVIVVKRDAAPTFSELVGDLRHEAFTAAEAYRHKHGMPPGPV